MVTSERRPWIILAGCFLMSTGFNAYLFGPASLIPLLVDQFAIDKASAGLSISALFLGWVLLQIPGGFLMDRYDNRRLVWIGMIVFAFVSLAGYLSSTYTVFLVTRFLGGGAAVFLWTTNANIVSQSFPASTRAVATSLFITSAPVGVTIAQFIGPHIASVSGWRAIFFVYPLVSLLGMVVLYWAAREPIRTPSQLDLSTFVKTLSNPTILLVSLSSFCAYSLFVFFNSWMPTYATEVLALDLASAGAITALVPLAGIVARPGGGWLSDRIGDRRRPVIAFAFLLSLPILGGISVVTSTSRFAILLFLAGIGSQLGTGVFYVYVSELSDQETQGTQLAILTTLSMAGAFIAPAVAGWLVDEVSWGAAFVFTGLIGIIGIATIVVAPRS